MTFDSESTSEPSKIEFDKVTTAQPLPLVAQNFPAVPPNCGMVLSAQVQIPFPLGANLGGTGISTYAIGDILYADSTSTLARLAIGAETFVLTVSGGIPVWSAPTGMGFIGGSGTAGKIPKFATGSTVTDSIISEDTSKIGINDTSPFYTLDINGTARLQGMNKLWFGGTAGAGDTALFQEIAGRLRLSGQMLVTNSSGPSPDPYGTDVVFSVSRTGVGESATMSILAETEAGIEFYQHDSGTPGYPNERGGIFCNLADGTQRFDINGADMLIIDPAGATVGGKISGNSFGKIVVEELLPGDFAIRGRNLDATGLGAEFLTTDDTLDALRISDSGGTPVHQFRGNGVVIIGASLAVGGGTGNITGTWDGVVISPLKGGTGLASYEAGDIIYASATNTLAALPVDTDGFVLTLVAGMPAWAAGGGGGGMGGSGTSSKLPKFTASTTLGDSVLTEGSGNIQNSGFYGSGIAPTAPFHASINSDSYTAMAFLHDTHATGIPYFQIGKSSGGNDSMNWGWNNSTQVGAFWISGNDINSGDGLLLKAGPLFGVGVVPTARFQVKGSGTGTGVGFLFEDSSGADKLTILDNGNATLDGNFIQAAGKTIAISSGSNQRSGNATLVGGTVTVNNTTITANTVVVLTRKTSGGTIGMAVNYTLNAGTSFTITSDNILDTSVYSYLLIEVP